MEKRLLAKRYELGSRISAGGMATVFRGVDTVLGRPVAVKLLHANLAADAAFVERFRREARLAASLQHDSVVAIYDAGEEADGTAYIVMELVNGRNLHQLLRDRGSLSPEDTARVGCALLDALGHAHERGLIHRDVKPANVLVTDDGAVKVTDFGIARALDATAALTQTGTLMGTASYISPEQAGGHPATALSDLYASGCVLFECMTGRPPFTGENPLAVALAHQRDAPPSLRGLRPDTPAALDAVIMRALAKEPSARFSSAQSMAAAIRSAGLERGTDGAATAVLRRDAAPTVAGARAPAPTQVLGTRPRGPQPTRIGRTFAWIGIALLAGALVWLLTAYVGLSRPAPTPTPSPRPTPAPTRRTTPRPPAVVVTPEITPEVTLEPVETPESPDTPFPEPTFDLPGFGDG